LVDPEFDSCRGTGPGLAEASAQNLYRAMDVLTAHPDAIQRAVFKNTASLLNLEADLLLVDATSVYFEVEDADGDNGPRHFGHSKDHRGDRPQIVVALAVIRQGIPGRFRLIAENLEAKEIKLERGSERRRFVLARNPAEAERDRQHREAVLAELEQELERESGAAAAPGHGRRTCGLFAHATYGRYLKQDRHGRPIIDREKVRAEARLDGKYLISATDPGLSVSDVVLGFKQLADVERAFRPVHHQRPHRIEAHVLLCWLALLLVRGAESETGQTWRAIREDMEELTLVRLSGKDGRFDAVSRPTNAQLKILKDLNLSRPKEILSADTTPAAA